MSHMMRFIERVRRYPGGGKPVLGGQVERVRKPEIVEQVRAGHTLHRCCVHNLTVGSGFWIGIDDGEKVRIEDAKFIVGFFVGRPNGQIAPSGMRSPRSRQSARQYG
jgi:hypothetical protein